MAYPSGIQALTEKQNGPGQIIYASHLNDIKTALDEVQALLGNAPQGNMSSVESRLDILTDDDGKLNAISHCLFVGKSGCHFSSIQSAIDSITDQSDTNQYAVIVFPGIYTETVTPKAYVHITGLIPCSPIFNTNYFKIPTRITAPSSQNAVILSGGSIGNLEIYSNQNTPVIVANSNSAPVYNCLIHGFGNSPIVSATSKEPAFLNCRFDNEGGLFFSLSGGACYLQSCLLMDFTGGSAWSLSNAAKLYFFSSIIETQGETPALPSGTTIHARLTMFSNYPSGDGTLNLGTMNGTCCDTGIVW